MKEKAPKRIGKFKIIGIIGKGGMGDVYKAIQEPLNRIVAIKMLPEEYLRNEEFLERFITEAKAISKLDHQNIVGIYDYGSEGNSRYIAMRYIEGVDLAEKIAKEKRLNIRVALEYTRQICRALKYAHERDILHRDIKPQNILINKDNRVFVTDFGIAKIYEQTGFTKTGVVVGTPEYMSPEQAEGLKLNSQTDIYSLGIVLYEMITGMPPFTGDNPLSIAYKHVNVQPPPLSEKCKNISKQLELIVLKAIKKDRNYRYRNVDEFLEDIDKSDISDSKKTREMNIISGVKKKKLFENEKRIVDRRSSDRRRETRRVYLRRSSKERKKRGRFIFLAVIIGVVSGFLVFSFVQRLSSRKSFGEYQPVIKKLVGEGHPEYAIDDNIATCWQYNGQNPNFSLYFISVKLVNRIDIVSGNNSGEDTFLSFSRPKKILFIFNGNVEFKVELEDTRERQVITVPGLLKVERVKMVVKESFPGKNYSDICLTEVKFWNSPMP